MRTKQGRTLSSLRSTHGFISANPDALASVIGSGAFQQLTAVITSLDVAAAAQSGSNTTALGLTQRHRSARTVLLRDHMAPVARIAAASLPHTPELQPLRMPSGRPNAERLKAMADGMADAAEPYKQVFVDAGLAADFQARLRTAGAEVVDAVLERTKSHAARRQATMGLETKLSEGRKLVHVLDAIVSSVLKDDPDLLAAWKLASRVNRAGAGTSTSATEAPASQGPAASPAAPAAATPLAA